ncbi:hypothetical protein BYT27DRAFT_6808254 [Phlegmacium glaucopus]|nr:hypothetical protein BYT27DRAFT_6808254 [Phlegmacium glaucopus]
MHDVVVIDLSHCINFAFFPFLPCFYDTYIVINFPNDVLTHHSRRRIFPQHSYR